MLLFILLISLSSFKGVPDSSSILIRELNKSETRVHKVDALIRLGNYYTKLNSSDSVGKQALTYFLRAKDLSFQAKSTDLQCKSLIALGAFYLSRGNEKIGLKYYKFVVQFYHKAGRLQKEAETLSDLGDRVTQSSLKLKFQKQAQVLFRRQDKDLAEAFCVKKIAEIHLSMGQLKAAEQEANNFLKILSDIRYPKLYYAFELLENINFRLQRFDKALFYQLKGIENSEQLRDTTRMAQFYVRVAILYMVTGNQEKAKIYILKDYDYTLKRAVSQQLSLKEEYHLYDLVRIINNYYYREHNLSAAGRLIRKTFRRHPPVGSRAIHVYHYCLADYYSAAESPSLAETYYKKIWEYSMQEENRTRQIELGEFPILEFYAKHRMYYKMKPYLHQLSVFDGFSPLYKQRLNRYNYLLDSAAGRWKEALKHHQEYDRIDKEFQSANINLQIKDIEFKLQKEKEEKQLLANKQERALQSANIKKSEVTRNYTFAVIALLSVILFLLYMSYRSKLRSQAQLNRHNDSLQLLVDQQLKLIEEKEWLVKEVHHRVKNNLQIIVSLLDLQHRTTENKQGSDAIKSSQNRIRSMAMLHQHLYQTDTPKAISIESYIRELIQYLESSITHKKRLAFELDLDSIKMDVSQVVPIGLIINEAVTNSIKYAFTEEPAGKIFIRLKKIKEKTTLTISDNGQGLSEDFEEKQSKSLGLNLIQMMAQQLDGEFSFINGQGLSLEIDFPTTTP